MKLRCSAQDLMIGLINATRALAARPSTPVLEYVKVNAIKDHVVLTCTDGSLTIRTDVKAEIEEEGDILLPGKLLTEIVRKLPEGVVSLSTNEKNVTVIKCQSSRSTLAGMPAEEFPEMRDIINTHALHVPQKRLKDMISRVIFAIAQHESRQTLTGSLMEVTKDEIRLVGLDGFRLALQTMKGEFVLPDGKSIIKAIVPGHVMSEMSRIMVDEENAMVTFHMDFGHLMAIIGDTTVLTTLLAGEYINYRQILPTDWKTRITVKCKEFEDAIERASLIAREGKNNLIKIKAENDMMQLTSMSDMGDVLEEINIHLEGEAIEIAFNARYIGDVVKNIDDECCMLSMSNSVSPCVLSPVDGDAYLYLVLPVRVSN